GPRGIAIRFHLAQHVHTEIVAHSTNGFPVRTGEEFLAFLRAAAAFGAGRPEALGAFLAAHPHAQRFVDTPKPIPTSFAREAFFAVTAFTFTNADGVRRHGRFRIRPEAGTAYLSNDDAEAQSADFLFVEHGPWTCARTSASRASSGAARPSATAGVDRPTGDASMALPPSHPNP